MLPELFEQYHDALSSILNEHAPLQTRSITQRPAAPWYNDDIAVQKSVRCKLGPRWRLSKCLVNCQICLDQRLLVRNLVKAANRSITPH